MSGTQCFIQIKKIVLYFDDLKWKPSHFRQVCVKVIRRLRQNRLCGPSKHARKLPQGISGSSLSLCSIPQFQYIKQSKSKQIPHQSAPWNLNFNYVNKGDTTSYDSVYIYTHLNISGVAWTWVPCSVKRYMWHKMVHFHPLLTIDCTCFSKGKFIREALP